MSEDLPTSRRDLVARVATLELLVSDLIDLLWSIDPAAMERLAADGSVVESYERGRIEEFAVTADDEVLTIFHRFGVTTTGPLTDMGFDALSFYMTARRLGIPLHIIDGDRTVFTASVARRKGLSLLLSRRMRSSHLARAATLVAERRVDLAGLVGERHPLAAGGPAWEALVSPRSVSSSRSLPPSCCCWEP